MVLAEVCLLTNDVPRLAGFYKLVLNTKSDCESDVHQVILVDGAALTVYNDGTQKNNCNQNICIAFTVENVDFEYERLTKLGLDIIDPPTTRLWGARNMHFCDPEGNHVYFRTILRK